MKPRRASSGRYSGPEDLNLLYLNRTVVVDGKKMDLGTAWLGHPLRRTFKSEAEANRWISFTGGPDNMDLKDEIKAAIDRAAAAAARGHVDDDLPAVRVRPICQLWDEDLSDPEPILGTWLTQRHLSMIYAPAGCGKSFLTMSIAMAVAGGGSLFGWKAPKARRVLVVDGEMDQIDLRNRTLTLLKAMPDVDEALVRENLYLLAYHDQPPGATFPDIGNASDREVILSLAEEARAELVIFDNFSTLATVEDENAASSFDPFIDLMRKLKVAGRAAILVHHSRKNTKGESSYRGTSKMAVVFNTIIKLDLPDGMRPRGGARFDLTFEKFRGLADETTAPMRCSLTPEGGWEYEASPASLIERMVALIKTVEFPTQDALAEELGVTKSHLSKLKKKAIAGGLISRDEWQRCLEMARTADADDDEDIEPDF